MKGDIRRFTADEAMRMVEVGILGDDEHVQLLDGMLIETKQQSPVHSAMTVQLGYLMREVYEDAVTVCEQKPLTTDTYSLPEPDLIVVNRDFRDFEMRHPKGNEAILVVELAWSTQDAKRRKAPI